MDEIIPVCQLAKQRHTVPRTVYQKIDTGLLRPKN